MKQRMKKILTTVVALLVIVNLSGCALLNMFGDFDAQRYTQGCLDAALKGEFDDYTATTGMTKEEAQKEYDERMEKDIQSMGITGISDEMKQKYKDLFAEIYGKCKYEVGEAKKNEDDSFTVPVTAYKLKAFDGCVERIQNDITEWAEEIAESGATQPSNEEVIEKTMNILLECITENLEKLEYGDATTIEITVTGKKDGLKTEYSIADSDFTKILNACLDTEAMTAAQ